MFISIADLENWFNSRPHLMNENILLDMLTHHDMCIHKFIQQ